ncbi:hypothetical protein BJX99DRAFT_254567 [Aspergillus californicus]
MQSAANQFSTWITPHQAEDLDIILLGHSIGGVLAAEVALLKDALGSQPKHRILGLVNFDVPFLGIHPRVISTGLRGLFRKSPVLDEREETIDEDSIAAAIDPFFDPPFENDVHLEHGNRISSIMHYVQKNIDHLSRSMFDGVMSYYKFPGHLNRIPQLRQRYKLLEILQSAESTLNRVRFVNYYTASTGCSKAKAEKGPEASKIEIESEGNDGDTRDEPSRPGSAAGSVGGGKGEEGPRSTSLLKPSDQMRSSASDSTLAGRFSAESTSPADIVSTNTLSNPTDSTDGQRTPIQNIKSVGNETESTQRKHQTFVLLPSHHWKYGDNSLWIPVRMEDMDEVKAHQSMFLPHGATYSQLVGDTVTQIEGWVQDDLTARMLRDMINQG